MSEEKKNVEEKETKVVESKPLQLIAGNEAFIQIKLLEAVNKNLQILVRQQIELKLLLSAISEKK